MLRQRVQGVWQEPVSCLENAAAGLRKKGAKELGGAPGVWPGY